jgi:hypothetical protein
VPETTPEKVATSMPKTTPEGGDVNLIRNKFLYTI